MIKTGRAIEFRGTWRDAIGKYKIEQGFSTFYELRTPEAKGKVQVPSIQI